MRQHNTAKYRVRGLSIGGRPHGYQPIRYRNRVVVGQHDKVAVDVSESGVQGNVLTQPFFREISERQPVLKGCDDIPASVSAGVVHDDQLPPPFRCSEPEIGVQYDGECTCAVASREYDGEHDLSSVPAPGRYRGRATTKAANVTRRVRTVGIEHSFGSGRVEWKFGFTRFRGTK